MGILDSLFGEDFEKKVRGKYTAAELRKKLGPHVQSLVEESDLGKKARRQKIVNRTRLPQTGLGGKYLDKRGAYEPAGREKLLQEEEHAPEHAITEEGESVPASEGGSRADLHFLGGVWKPLGEDYPGIPTVGNPIFQMLNAMSGDVPYDENMAQTIEEDLAPAIGKRLGHTAGRTAKLALDWAPIVSPPTYYDLAQRNLRKGEVGEAIFHAAIGKWGATTKDLYEAPKDVAHYLGKQFASLKAKGGTEAMAHEFMDLARQLIKEGRSAPAKIALGAMKHVKLRGLMEFVKQHGAQYMTNAKMLPEEAENYAHWLADVTAPSEAKQPEGVIPTMLTDASDWELPLGAKVGKKAKRGPN